MASPKSLASAAGMIRSRLTPALRIRGGRAGSRDCCDDEPSGRLRYVTDPSYSAIICSAFVFAANYMVGVALSNVERRVAELAATVERLQAELAATGERRQTEPVAGADLSDA